MEKKKATVNSVVYKKEFSNSYGVSHIFDVSFDNGDSGQFFSKNKNQTEFVEGSEIEYMIEKKVNGQYTNYSIKSAQQNGFTPGKGNPAFEHKRTALKCAVDLCVGGKIELAKISDYAQSFMKFLNE